MLNEYALEPAAIVESWDRFRLLTGLFNVEDGRVISKFPRKWARIVYDATNGLTPVAKLKIVENLHGLDRKMVSSGRAYDDLKSWIENASVQHNKKPFKAIISKSPLDHVDEHIHPDDVTEHHPLINVPREIPVKRTADDIAACVCDFLQNSKTLIFLDPHFKPTRPKWTNVLRKLLETAVSGKHRIQKCEYHFHWKDDELDQASFTRSCTRLADNIPTGVTVKFIGWKERDDGEKFHARYILTDIGGVRFDVGLDHQIGGENQTTDVGLLDRDLYERRLSELQPESSAFDFVASAVVRGKHD